MEVKVGPDYQFPNVTEFFNGWFVLYMYFPSGSDGKESACNVGDPGSIPGIFPGEGQCQRIPVFLPREFRGQRSLAGYNPWVCKELDTTEQLTLIFLLYIFGTRLGEFWCTLLWIVIASLRINSSL